MRKIVDCFLYHNEEQLLEIRLQLLGNTVDKCVIVCSKETFTGKCKKSVFPKNKPTVDSFRDRIDLIICDKLEGKNAWEKEAYSRNLLATRLVGLSDDDLVMVSDVDEIPRPSVIEFLKTAPGFNGTKVLELEYFNFKMNFKMFHGVHAIWAGPTVTAFKNFTSPQTMRDQRWNAMAIPDTRISNAGWHFSFLTENENVSEKLASFSHQERDIQSRTQSIYQLLQRRQGFHDHLHPGAIWGFADISTYNCPELERLVRSYPEICDSSLVDDSGLIEEQIKRSMSTAYHTERAKILRRCTVGELLGELKRRVVDRVTWSA